MYCPNSVIRAGVSAPGICWITCASPLLLIKALAKLVQPSLVGKFYVRNRGLNTLWDLDDPNRPNSVHNSETMLLDWGTTGDNWSQCHGGKGANRKIGVIKKEQTSKLLVDEIKKASITVPGNPIAVSAKLLT